MSVSRRGFFSRLVGAAVAVKAAPTVTTTATAEPPPEYADAFIHQLAREWTPVAEATAPITKMCAFKNKLFFVSGGSAYVFDPDTKATAPIIPVTEDSAP